MRSFSPAFVPFVRSRADVRQHLQLRLVLSPTSSLFPKHLRLDGEVMAMCLDRNRPSAGSTALSESRERQGPLECQPDSFKDRCSRMRDVNLGAPYALQVQNLLLSAFLVPGL